MISATIKTAVHCARAFWLALVLIGMPALVFAPGGLCAQQGAPSEYEIKAAYLYNFGKFVHWPARVEANRNHAFSVCVLGQDPFGATLKAILSGQNIDGQQTVAATISKPEDAGNCRILFISASEGRHLKEIMTALDDSSVLTVSDLPSFSKRGGMVEFVLDNNKVRFEVNLGKAQRAGLTMSSELLKLAIAVRTNPLGN
jgi:uncharacterized protein DUF4154